MSGEVQEAFLRVGAYHGETVNRHRYMGNVTVSLLIVSWNLTYFSFSLFSSCLLL